MRKVILSSLLHHANRNTKDERFYAIKNRLLQKFGTVIGYDVQAIPGKKCFTCGGSGVYVGYYWESGDQWSDTCNRCWGNGWFKDPVWNVLEKVRFGKYSFHQPVKRCYSPKEAQAFVAIERRCVEFNPIEGYIDHRPTQWGSWALLVLFLLYDRKKMPSDIFLGWRVNWWKSIDGVCHNIAHVLTRRSRSRPAYRFREWREKRRQKQDLRIFHGEVADQNRFPW